MRVFLSTEPSVSLLFFKYKLFSFMHIQISQNNECFDKNFYKNILYTFLMLHYFFISLHSLQFLFTVFCALNGFSPHNIDIKRILFHKKTQNENICVLHIILNLDFYFTRARNSSDVSVKKTFLVKRSLRPRQSA